MKVIFLDIDGVMNTEASMIAAHDKGYDGSSADGWDLNAVANLKRILETTGAEIVISSTWRFERFQPELLRAFQMYGLPCWIGVTPRKMSLHSRGGEIAMWIRDHLDECGVAIERYVILDDDSDMLDEQKPFFVKTHFRNGGLTKELADKAIEILND